MGRISSIAVLAAGFSGVVFTAPAYGAPAVLITPSTALRDGAEVTVTLTGFLPEPAQLSLIQCKPASIDIGGCEVTHTEEVVYFDLDGTGTATAKYTVETIPGACDDVNPCSLFAIEDPSNFGAEAPYRAVETPFSFTAASPRAASTSTGSSAGTRLLLPLGAAAAVALAAAVISVRRRRRPIPG